MKEKVVNPDPPDIKKIIKRTRKIPGPGLLTHILKTNNANSIPTLTENRG